MPGLPDHDASEPPLNPDSRMHERFMRLFAAHDRRIYGYILVLVPNRTDAEDIFSETSVVLWREFAKFRPDADFAPWAMAIAFNQVRKHRRKRKNDPLLFGDGLLSQLAQSAERMSEQAAPRREALSYCLESISKRNRELIQRFYGGNESAGQIAADWGRSIHAVYKALKTVRRNLSDCIARRLIKEEGP